MKRILVLTVLAGMGHIRAAEAICEGIGRVSPESVVWLKDPLEEEPKRQRFVNDFYVFMARHLPHLWGYFYNTRLLSSVYSPMRWYITRRYVTLIAKNIKEFQPEVIVSTHPFLAAAVGVLKKYKGLDIPLISVATDFHVHSFGINKQVNIFVVPCEEMVRYLEGQGIPSERIVIEGIPISPKFSVPMGTEEAKEKLGLDKDTPLVLILSGGFGIGPVLDLLRAFDGVKGSFQLAIIIGRDERLRQKAEEIVHGLDCQAKVFGFVDNMEEFMSAADLIITKPGGMSVSEALAKKVPLVLMQAIKGQEEWNVRVLVKAGAAVYSKDVRDIPSVVMGLLNDEAKYSCMREAAGRLGRPKCSEEIGMMMMGAI
ncbi:MAG: glycosyltransferase [Candidatus Desantisbacteria bacterium]